MKKDEAQKAQKKSVQRAPRQAAVAAAQKRERTKPRQFVREVVAELKKVAWPTRQEVVAYSIVVLVSVVVIGALIFAMDYVFTRAVLALYGVET